MKTVHCHGVLFFLMMFSLTTSVWSEQTELALLPTTDDFPGWSPSGDMVSYTADDMWKHINGAAEIYIRYACQKLTVAYFMQATDKAEITAEIYTMADNLHAFGIYSAQKPRETKPLIIGAPAFGEANTLTFFKGNYYVKTQVHPDTPQGTEYLQVFAKIIISKIKAETTLPELLTVFPTEFLVPDSFQYIPQGALGIKGLNKAFSALYRLEGDEITLFIFNHESEQEVHRDLETFSQAIGRRAETPPKPVTLGHDLTGTHDKDRYLGPFWALELQSALIIVLGTENKEWVENTVTYVSTKLVKNK